MNCSTPGLPVYHQLLEFTQLMSIELVMPPCHHILCMRLTVSIEGLAECLKHCQQSINVSYLYLSQKTWIILVSSVLLWTIYIISLSHYLIICKVHLCFSIFKKNLRCVFISLNLQITLYGIIYHLEEKLLTIN